MGLYNAICQNCHKTFLWFSGNPIQICEKCLKPAQEQTLPPEPPPCGDHYPENK